MFEILLIIPFTNAEVERLFTKMNHIKTIERNWFGRDHLHFCVREEGPPLDELNVADGPHQQELKQKKKVPVVVT